MGCLKPSPMLERTVKMINEVFGFAGVQYWLSFGGLFGIVKNDGIIPDGDFDICVRYGEDWKRIVRAFDSWGMKLSKGIVNDVDKSNMLYCGFNYSGAQKKFAHICLSFWYPANGKRWYCHDQKMEMQPGQVGVPPSGYWFKGVPEHIVDDRSLFKMVEWPGLDGAIKVNVPIMAGTLLDTTYIGWAYKFQRYNVKGNKPEPDKMQSYYRSGAISPDMVHLKSVADFGRKSVYEQAHAEGKAKWDRKLKEVSKTTF